MKKLINVFESGENLVVSSREVAKNFGKQHKHVLESIDKMLKNSTADISTLFITTEYKARNGKTNREILITEKGLNLYLFNIEGFLQEKLNYINEFDRMKEFIKQSGQIEAYKNFRITGKTVRRDLTNTIQNEINPNNSFVFSNYTNLIYKKLFGKTAKQLKTERGLVKKDNIRDNLTLEELNNLIELEDKVRSFIITFKAMGMDEKEIYYKVKDVI